MVTEYITRDGERWDTIAYKAYGTIGDITIEGGVIVNAVYHLQAANPTVAINDIIKGGIRLQVPIIESTASETDINKLPPWKR